MHGIEFDVIHVRNNENVLSLDFTHSSEAKESKHFMDDLQVLSDSIGIDKVRIHRDMSPEEVKNFVKQRFEHQLKQGGLEDSSLYMSRFDTLYEQGKMEKMMPTANQKHIVEDVPITEWDNPYFEVREPEQMAFSVKDKFVSIQTCTDGYDYSVFDADYKLIDGGVYDNPDISIYAALKDVLEDFGVSEQEGSDLDVVVEYKGKEHEDDLFNAFNEDGLMIGGVKVDINPITESKTGTLATYLPGVESYLAEKQAMQMASAKESISEKSVTLTVAECGEFHNLGEHHENIASVEEAIAVWKSIPPECMNGIPSIGINIHTEGTEPYEYDTYQYQDTVEDREV